MNFDVAEPLRIHKQAKPDECTSSALSAIAEDVLGVPVDDDYIYNNSHIDGKFGIQPEIAMNAVFKKGVLAVGAFAPVFPFTSSGQAFPWIFRFDSMIRMMQRNKSSFFCGCYWQDAWTDSPDGIMRTVPQPLNWFPHAFKVFGAINIDGKMYLKVQNSLGETKGDHGIFYAPKETVTKFLFAYQLL